MTQKYQVIARKYRPQSFSDVVGQESAVTTLKNAIRFDKVAHAYLFCGSRGVGKTTLARLFAKALNCASPTPELEPCNHCPSCAEIAAGQSLDVIEIDGASNRGIDDIRQINETVGYAPAQGKYKIYIIDEVHMLTKEAFNALLKTLEEPPERAKFFFATTEPQKVLPTILSRCQRFDLARISLSLIASKLDSIAKDLNRDVEPTALHLIASFAEGSLRDAESLFDQILCFAENRITASIVRESLGLVSEELFFALDQAFSEGRISYAFELVDLLFQKGKDLGHFLEQLLEHYRALALFKTMGEKALAPEIASRIAPSAKLYTQSQSLYILDLLIQSEAQFQKSSFQRASLESILLQIIRSRHRIPIEVIVRRLTELEESLSKTVPLEETATSAPTEEPIRPAQKAPTELKPVPFATAVEPIQEIPPAPVSEEKKASPPPVKEAPLPQEEKPISAVEEKKPPLAAQKPKAPLPEPKTEIPSSSLEQTSFAQEQAPRKDPMAEQTPTLQKPTPSNSFSVKHPSHYDTLMRFAAVELEGSLKNN